MLTGVKSLVEGLIKFKEDKDGPVGGANDSKRKSPGNDEGSLVVRQN